MTKYYTTQELGVNSKIVEKTITAHLLYDLERERTLIGACLYHPQVEIPKIKDIIKPFHFFSKANSIAFDCIIKSWEKNKNSDKSSLSNLILTQISELEKSNFKPQEHDSIPAVKGNCELYLRNCENRYILGVTNTEGIANDIKDFYKRREIQKILQNASISVQSQFSLDYTIDSITQGHLAKIQDVLNENGNLSHNYKRVGMAKPQDAKSKENGIKTGIEELDKMTGGLKSGHLTILAGASGMGKTALTVNILTHIAKSSIPVGFLSMEMPMMEILERIYSYLAQKPFDKLDEQEREKTYQESKKLDFFVDEADLQGANNYDSIVNGIKALVNQCGVKVVFIDYLDFIKLNSPNKNINQADVLGDITNGLKMLAKNLKIHIVLLVQLNREALKANGGRPTLTAIRGSSKIENAADLILFIFRQAKVLQDNKPTYVSDYQERRKAWEAWNESIQENQNKGELIVGKYRHGKHWDVDLECNLETNTFKSIKKSNYSTEQ